MSAAVDFHSQIASIMEVLANAAVAEICKVVDDGYAVVQLEMSRSQKESECLRRKVKLLELQVARYRAERMKTAEGSSNSRFHGVRLLNRQNREPGAGPSLQTKTRFLNRGLGTQQSAQKTPPIILDQDPDQEVVTTTKTESVEPEEQQEEDLLIVKVEEPTETDTIHQGATLDAGGGDADPPTSLPTSSKDDVGQLSETEAQRCPTLLTSPKSEQKETGDPPEEKSPVHLLELPERKQNVDVERPSCSSYTASSAGGSSMPSLSGLLRSLPDPAGLNGPYMDLDLKRPKSEPDVVMIKSEQDTSGGLILPQSGAGGPGNLTGSQYPPLLGPPPGESTWDIPTYKTAPFSMEMADLHQQQQQHSWSGVQQMDGFSNQNLVYQSTSIQNQDTRSLGPQAPSGDFNYRRKPHADRRYECPQCGKRFERRFCLRRHVKLHSGEKPFPCAHCEKRFATATNLKAHETVHTRERRFDCNICGKTFSFHSNLSRHRLVHNIRVHPLH
ncbi:Krueppel-like factor 15 [Cheilinus undulatus]|uniref:Krueppel-like factor 15 n=1 Tax=Cheilinus undulatus TaxID=241271 RepID=UPI001BD5A1AC|nr:Krueppel-like factor 15 [Cheilinus undulatus]